MSTLSWLTCRHLHRFASPLCSILRRSVPPNVSGPARKVHRGPVRWTAEKGPWPRNRVPEPQHPTELDRADALMLRKSHETGFLSWFRNGLLATGIGVIAFVQSDIGREAAYAFFILGGGCVSFGAASYVGSLLSLRRLLLLSLPSLLLHTAVVSGIALFWLCAVSLYIGRLEVEIVHEEEEEGRDEGGECAECKARRDRHRADETGREK
ncbi:transmembrane protein 160 [Brachyhypopomus gauderio]|uniref:transmembrane protein 160 n=1 Tax=Brachyhypopomus gauderio TaxID=698409 RepID=UPI004042DCE5